MNRKYLKAAGPIFAELLRNPEVRVRYEEERAKSRIAMVVHAARKRANLTQVALAKKAGTTQGVIARLESGTDKRIPSMPLLSKIAKACGGFLEITFSFRRRTGHKVA